MRRMHKESGSKSIHPRPAPAPTRPASGFTLVEALVAMAIIVTGLTVGIPSYRGLVERQRVSSAMHLLTAHMAAARSTAISERAPTVVCPASPEGGCRADGDWSQRWLLFLDKDGNRQPDARADVLRDENAPIHPSLRIVSSQGRLHLRYLPDGRSAGSNISVRLCRGDRLLGLVIVNNVGRIRSEAVSRTRACMG